MKKLLKSLFAFALIAMLAVSAVYATNSPVKEKPANVYTYYLDSDCDAAIECSPDFDGNVCSIEFQNSIVYDAPGCQPANQTFNIIGKKRP